VMTVQTCRLVSDESHYVLYTALNAVIIALYVDASSAHEREIVVCIDDYITMEYHGSWPKCV
jgi:hypothetical protein